MSAPDAIAAQLVLARAALNPNAAIEAAPLAETAGVELEAPAGVPAPEATRAALAITMAIEIEPPKPARRWRWLLCYALLKLAARVYPFQIEFYRTRHPWE